MQKFWKFDPDSDLPSHPITIISKTETNSDSIS